MSNLYDLIKQHITLDTNPDLFSIYLNKADKTNLNDKELEIFNLLFKISQIYIKTNNLSLEIGTIFEFHNGKTTFKEQDITEKDLDILKNIDYKLLPLNFCAFLSFIVWHRKNKNNYDKLLLAFDAYLKLFKYYLNNNNTFLACKAIVITYNLSTKLNKDSEEYLRYKENVVESFLSSELSFHLTQTMVCLLAKMDGEVFDKVYSKLETISYNKPYQIIKLYEIKIDYFKFQKKDDLMKNTINEFASYLFDTGKLLIEKEPDYAYKILLYLLKLKRNHNLNYDSNEIISYIDKCNVCLRANMQPIEMKNMNSFTQKWIPFLRDSFYQLTKEEFIISISQMVKTYDKDLIKNELINNPNLIEILYPQIILDGNNQSVEIIQPLDLKNPESDIENLEKLINRRILTKECIVGLTYLSFCLELFYEKYSSISLNDLDFIVNQNSLIPPGREKIIRYGLWLVLTRHYFEALHILTPQIENIMRYIANCNGLTTTCLESNGESEVKIFGPTLDLLLANKVITDCEYFFLSGLLNKPSGANIRNRIAHGLMTEEEGQGGIGIYFCCFVVKLLILHSPECDKIKKDSESLKNLFNNII